MCIEETLCIENEKKRIKSAFIPVTFNDEQVTIVDKQKKKRISPEFQNFCRYLRERQNQMPLPDLTIATPFMRPQLVDWLFKTSEYLHLSKKIIFQTLTLVDLYTTRVVVNSDELGLIFVTSLFSCSKFESTGIKVSDVQRLCNNKYGKEDIIGMEKKLLESINYKIDNPTSYDFLNILWEAAGYPQYNQEERNHPIIEASIQFLQIMTLDPFYTSNSPSSLAGSAFFFARDFCHFVNLWDMRYQRCLMMKKEEVREVAIDFIPKMQYCVMNQNKSSFKVCIDFGRMIENHRRKYCECIKHIQSKNTKPQCFWDNNDVKNFD
ncbi:hypothetical protein ENUP19_0063G0024 [Entamoeba nuttalli]|uniref:Cyclin N-terminal domain-containing protein n=1 Tax=Entamoeba nuttalli TaxID=412467 RepID=A0ABQ0DDY5_9EUKA